MSDLRFAERMSLEKLFGMGSGYVLDFTNVTFQEFVHDSVRRNIYDVAYERGSGSKANRLRAFFEREPNHIVGRLISDLLDHYERNGLVVGEESVLADCRRVCSRLLQSGPVEDAEVFNPKDASHSFELVAKTVRESIDRNEPELGLDRLHTFVTMYIRSLCEAHGLAVDREKPLHSIFGEFVKRLRALGLIESKMTERILKSSIATLEAFNFVRNQQSLAHDNPVLNHDESLLIFNHIASSIRFLMVLGNRPSEPEEPELGPFSSDDIPF